MVLVELERLWVRLCLHSERRPCEEEFPGCLPFGKDAMEIVTNILRPRDVSCKCEAA